MIYSQVGFDTISGFHFTKPTSKNVEIAAFFTHEVDKWGFFILNLKLCCFSVLFRSV